MPLVPMPSASVHFHIQFPVTLPRVRVMIIRQFQQESAMALLRTVKISYMLLPLVPDNVSEFQSQVPPVTISGMLFIKMAVPVQVEPALEVEVEPLWVDSPVP